MASDEIRDLTAENRHLQETITALRDAMDSMRFEKDEMVQQECARSQDEIQLFKSTVAALREEFEKMRVATTGELALMADSVGGFTRDAGLELAPAAIQIAPVAAAAGPAVEANFYHFWDASLSAKDRAELMAASEAGTYDALAQLFGTALVRPGGRWMGAKYCPIFS